MRSRNIKPGFFENEKLGVLPLQDRLCFIGLWCVADREGRLEDRPMRLKVQIFPYDDTNVEKSLARLAALGFIQRYVVGNDPYIFVHNFKKHQSPHNTEKASVIPCAPASCQLTVNQPLNNESVTVNIALIPDSLIPERGTLNEDKEISSATETASKPLVVFECIGKPKEWGLSREQFNAWKRDYPGLDIGAEVRKAHAWIGANKRKTAVGMPRFLVNWFNRAVQKGQNGAEPKPAMPSAPLRVVDRGEGYEETREQALSVSGVVAGVLSAIGGGHE